ncbi:MAG: AI-2E family transporter [Geminicoccaceae bacterium]|nr:AI-2E family transporter [Geminicoccaceae bacterium]
MRQLRLLFYATGFAIMAGWLLRVGQGVILPIIAAVISLYILSAASAALDRVPLVRHMPLWLRRTIVLAGFTVAVFLLFSFIVTSFGEVAAALPRYQDTLEGLVARAADALGVAHEPNWERIRAATIGRLNVAGLIGTVVGSMGSFGGQAFLIVLYAFFLFAERDRFGDRLALAVGDAERRDRALSLLRQIDERIGNYLVVKTLVNVVLGAISFAIMWAIGIEFAPFWAVLIAFLNYIPYVGSLVGVLFPVLLSLAQFGSLGLTFLSLVLLTAAQVYVGNVLEPRLMSRAFNLSPFVVVLALAVWSALWGLPGAILAVPMTSILLIVLAEVEATRPIAIMLSANGKV